MATKNGNVQSLVNISKLAWVFQIYVYHNNMVKQLIVRLIWLYGSIQGDILNRALSNMVRILLYIAISSPCIRHSIGTRIERTLPP